MLALSDRIGVSTLCLKGISAAEAAGRTLEAGFSAFELTPITYGGPEAFGPPEREELRRLLQAFELVTVHSSGMGNICSTDCEERERSRQQYLALVEFAADVSADVLTAHPGQPGPEGGSEEDVRAENVAFGKEMLAAGEGVNMALGYELFDPQVARKIGSANFGVLFDLGHASRRGPEVDTADVLGMIDGLADQIVQFHAHGVGEPDKTDHLPFSQNTWLDYDRIVRHINAIRFSGPVIFEIGIRRENWSENLKDCIAAREALLQAVDG